jgi:voltage-gated potassium channel Kch
MLGLLWTVAYWLVAQVTPNAFAFNTTTGTRESMGGFNAFYFSFITLSTVGYGDITPVSRIARWLAATEAMTGLLYVTVLIARLVSLYSSPKSQ